MSCGRSSTFWVDFGPGEGRLRAERQVSRASCCASAGAHTRSSRPSPPGLTLRSAPHLLEEPALARRVAQPTRWTQYRPHRVPARAPGPGQPGSAARADAGLHQHAALSRRGQCLPVRPTVTSFSCLRDRPLHHLGSVPLAATHPRPRACPPLVRAKARATDARRSVKRARRRPRLGVQLTHAYDSGSAAFCRRRSYGVWPSRAP